MPGAGGGCRKVPRSHPNAGLQGPRSHTHFYLQEKADSFETRTMTSAQILAGLGNGLFTVAMLVTSLRCLLLWRRTREVPELAIGMGFLLLAGFGFPLMAIAGIGSGAVSGVNHWLLGLGLAAIGLGIFSLQVFLWKTFRPHQAWAALLTWATLVGALAICIGSLRTLDAAPADAEPIAATRSWWLALRLAFEAWYVWTAVESLSEHARARRRLALGLSDPVVVNRFLLFGAMGAYLALNGAVATALEYRGMSPLTDALPALVLAANGGVAAILILLAFVPPKAYVARIRRNAAVAA